jgi:anti-sigma regulatory factor (Ser/Thr protein kinase)
MDGQPNIRLQIQSNTLFLSGVRELVYHVASRVGFCDEHCGQMALAVDEAICNVIRHGYGRAPDRPIWISLHCDGGIATPDTHGTSPTTALRIVIEDEARQVDIATIKSRDLDEIRPGGLGVHIIQQVMDDVKYEHRSDHNGLGMRLTMTKVRGPHEHSGPAETDDQADDASGKASAGSACSDAASQPKDQGR